MLRQIEESIDTAVNVGKTILIVGLIIFAIIIVIVAIVKYGEHIEYKAKEDKKNKICQDNVKRIKEIIDTWSPEYRRVYLEGYVKKLKMSTTTYAVLVIHNGKEFEYLEIDYSGYCELIQYLQNKMI